HSSYPLVAAPWIETNTGDGSIASTAADMATYVRMLLNRGQGPNGRLLSEQSFDLLIHPNLENVPGIFYCYGINKRDIDGFTCIGHGGDMPGFEANMQADMDNGIGV